jgi:catechol 1,2-dioxygenase
MIERRRFLVTLAAALATPRLAAAEATCTLTRHSILGPYYLPDAPMRHRIAEADEPGERLVLTGRVLFAPTCAPAGEAVLDVWQANAKGRYYNVDPGSPSAPDQLRLRGRLRADREGRYRIETVMPGAYPLQPQRFRPRHVHVLVSHPRAVQLTTQVYFSGDPYLAQDPFVREGQTVTLARADGVWQGTHDFVLDLKG